MAFSEKIKSIIIDSTAHSLRWTVLRTIVQYPVLANVPYTNPLITMPIFSVQIGAAIGAFFVVGGVTDGLKKTGRSNLSIATSIAGVTFASNFFKNYNPALVLGAYGVAYTAQIAVEYFYPQNINNPTGIIAAASNAKSNCWKICAKMAGRLFWPGYQSLNLVVDRILDVVCLNYYINQTINGPEKGKVNVNSYKFTLVLNSLGKTLLSGDIAAEITGELSEGMFINNMFGYKKKVCDFLVSRIPEMPKVGKGLVSGEVKEVGKRHFCQQAT